MEISEDFKDRFLIVYVSVVIKVAVFTSIEFLLSVYNLHDLYFYWESIYKWIPYEIRFYFIMTPVLVFVILGALPAIRWGYTEFVYYM